MPCSSLIPPALLHLLGIKKQAQAQSVVRRTGFWTLLYLLASMSPGKSQSQEWKSGRDWRLYSGAPCIVLWGCRDIEAQGWQVTHPRWFRKLVAELGL